MFDSFALKLNQILMGFLFAENPALYFTVRHQLLLLSYLTDQPGEQTSGFIMLNDLEQLCSILYVFRMALGKHPILLTLTVDSPLILLKVSFL